MARQERVRRRRVAAPRRLFAYGTLRDPLRVRDLLGHARRTVPATLSGFQLRRGRWPYVVPGTGGKVEGVLLLDLGADDFRRLDDYEVTHPRLLAGAMRRLYRRDATEVRATDGRTIRCWIYLPNLADWRRDWR